MWNDRRLSTLGALSWILALAILAVGARNFELGLSADAPLYAAISRNIIRSHEWFYLYGGVPDFVPYAEHPHLGFWLVAAVFKILPFADWAARVVGHLYYVGFLFLFFFYIRRVSDEKVAVWSVLLLWIWSRFSNYFSNVYLDPGALFFGSLSVVLWEMALRERLARLAPLAGVSLGLCALYKGLTVLGFLPAWACLAVVHRPRAGEGRRFGQDAMLALAGMVIPGVLYVAALHYSRVPDFLSLYWHNQMSQRYSRLWNWGGLFRLSFWHPLLRDTYYLAPLALTAFLPGRSRDHLWVPSVLVVTFLCMFAPAERNGNQYELMYLPWIAWLTAEGALARLPVNSGRLVRWSAGLSVVTVCVLQYLPVRLHHIEPPSEAPAIRRVAGEEKLRRAILDEWPRKMDFLSGAPYAWYGDVDVDYAAPTGAVPRASTGVLYVLLHSPLPQARPERVEAMRKGNWCLRETLPGATLWLACKRL